jgi:hypothetical protein
MLRICRILRILQKCFAFSLSLPFEVSQGMTIIYCDTVWVTRDSRRSACIIDPMDYKYTNLRLRMLRMMPMPI